MVESICAIGFSGHRELPDPEQIQQKLTELLDSLGRNSSSRLIGICSVAIGADLIFIEACLKRNLPWMAILPMPASMFFNEKDFPDEKDRLRALALLETAAYFEITNPVFDQDLKYDTEYRKDAFSDSGQRIVDYCDVFVAALRQKHDPFKPGGTGDILEYVKRCRRPVAAIDPDSGHIEHHNWHTPFATGFVAEFGSLDEAPLRQEFLSAGSSRELRIVVDYFSRLSAAARRNVPRLRSMSSTIAILTTVVAVLGLALITLPSVLSGSAADVVKHVSAFLSSLAFFAAIWFIFAKPHQRAARYRLGAEICRSLIATWDLPETHRSIFRGLPAEYKSLVRAVLNFRRLEGPKPVEMKPEEQSAEDSWKASISDYLKGRVETQLVYYDCEQKKARRRLRVFEPLRAIFALGSLLVSAVLALAFSMGYAATGRHAEFADFLKVALPGSAGVFISLLAVHEAKRRDDRYGEMLETLKENAARLTFAAHKKAACDVVVDNERALLAENIEWANIAKYPATG